MKVTTWPIDKVKPYPGNPRSITDRGVDKVVASIKEFGFNQPIVVDKKGVIIVGHTRHRAANKMGLTEVPVLQVNLPAEKARAYRLADNRTHEEADWIDDLLRIEFDALKGLDLDLTALTGFESGEIDRVLRGDMSSYAPVTIPEPPRDPVTRTGDLWLLGTHRLLCGDSTSHDDVRRLMNGERATLFSTDPPYLVDYDGSNHPTRNKDWSESYGNTWDDSSQGSELYDGFISAAVAEAITENAAWYCWHASRRQAMLEECWVRAGAFVHQQIIWSKDRGVLTRSTYLWKHEPCLMGWMKGKRPARVAKNMLSTIWEIASYLQADRPDHPTPKPLEIFTIPMEQHVKRGGLCYEPFSGSGSQIMAGESVGRRVNAMEIGPGYVDVAIKWWQQSTGKIAVLENGKTFAEVESERGKEKRSKSPPAAKAAREGRSKLRGEAEEPAGDEAQV